MKFLFLLNILIDLAYLLVIHFQRSEKHKIHNGPIKNILPGSPSGILFTFDKKRSFYPPNFFPRKYQSKNLSHCNGEKWAVLTTILPRTTVIDQIESINICLVIVADIKTPQNYPLKSQNSYFLTTDEQQKLPYNIIDILPFHNVARKCIGYLFAIQHGAKAIYDFDDDNYFEDNVDIYSQVFSDNHRWDIVDNDQLGINVYHYYSNLNETLIWPRGFPLELIKSNQFFNVQLSNNVFEKDISVIQFLQNLNPDLDAAFRITQNIPGSFHRSKLKCSIIPAKKYCSFNAQSTLFKYESFLGLILPMTVNARVSDIWRSYILQALLKEKYVGFCPAIVKHVRSPHNLLKDFNAEIPLYEQAHSFVKYLSINSFANDLNSIRKIYRDMYEAEMIEYQDIIFLEKWILDLTNIGYNL